MYIYICRYIYVGIHLYTYIYIVDGADLESRKASLQVCNLLLATREGTVNWTNISADNSPVGSPPSWLTTFESHGGCSREWFAAGSLGGRHGLSGEDSCFVISQEGGLPTGLISALRFA